MMTVLCVRLCSGKYGLEGEAVLRALRELVMVCMKYLVRIIYFIHDS